MAKPSESITNYLKERNIKKMTAIQEKSFDSISKSRSLKMFAPTGTGKTLAYLLPLFQRLKETEADTETPRLLIAAPTKELSKQIYAEAKSVSHHLKFRVRLCSGRRDSYPRLKEQSIDIIIGTVHHLNGLFKEKIISSKNVETIVFDEADDLLSADFRKDVRLLFSQINKEDIQVVLCSATKPAYFDKEVKDAFGETKFQTAAIDQNSLKTNVETYNIPLGQSEKPRMFELFVEKQAKGRGIVFANRNKDTVAIAQALSEKFPNKRVLYINGDLQRKERAQVLHDFEEKGGILISSDVLSRGIHIEKLNWILNYDLPFEAVYYVHRCGRVGRMGKKGTIYNFVTTKDANLIARINEAIKTQGDLLLRPIRSIENKKTTPTKKVTKSNSRNKKTVNRKVNKKKVSKKKRTPRYKRK